MKKHLVIILSIFSLSAFAQQQPLLKNKSANNPRKSEFLLNEVSKLQNLLNSDYRDKAQAKVPSNRTA